MKRALIQHGDPKEVEAYPPRGKRGWRRREKAVQRVGPIDRSLGRGLTGGMETIPNTASN